MSSGKRIINKTSFLKKKLVNRPKIPEIRLSHNTYYVYTNVNKQHTKNLSAWASGERVINKNKFFSKKQVNCPNILKNSWFNDSVLNTYVDTNVNNNTKNLSILSSCKRIINKTSILTQNS